MSAQSAITFAVIETNRFNRCADALARAFWNNRGSLTRGAFNHIARSNDMEIAVMQAYFESAGMTVQSLHGRKRDPCDRFVWDLRSDATKGAFDAT